MTTQPHSYMHCERIAVSVDCVIFGLHDDRLSLLLVKRRFEPEMGRWSLMGGFVRANESLDDAAKRVLIELTGLDDVYLQQVGTFGSVDRDPGGRVISVAYCALINFDNHDTSLVESHDARWFTLDTIPSLGFDHELMVESALVDLKKRMAVEPIAFNLLPSLFTLTKLQRLYETVTGEEIDKRNFRKRIAENPTIEKTSLIDKTGSRRGAALYRFNSQLLNTNPFRI